MSSGDKDKRCLQDIFNTYSPKRTFTGLILERSLRTRGIDMRIMFYTNPSRKRCLKFQPYVIAWCEYWRKTGKYNILSSFC